VRSIRAITAAAALAAATLLTAAPAAQGAPAAGDFGQHVRVCAQTMGFTGQHNPGMHQGQAGWDGMTCQM
jgi:hypothetical protein